MVVGLPSNPFSEILIFVRTEIGRCFYFYSELVANSSRQWQEENATHSEKWAWIILRTHVNSIHGNQYLTALSVSSHSSNKPTTQRSSLCLASSISHPSTAVSLPYTPRRRVRGWVGILHQLKSDDHVDVRMVFRRKTFEVKHLTLASMFFLPY